MLTLVTGGIRSGKSAYAESLLPTDRPVTYLATGPVPSADDPDWQARVVAHRLRRPASWTTVETTDVTQALIDATGVVLLDSLGSWVTATLDALHAWERPIDQWREKMQGRLDTLVDALANASVDVVIVSEEVGLGLVSEHRSGRVFADWLGTLNQRIASSCERVVLVVAGCPLTIKPAPPTVRR